MSWMCPLCSAKNEESNLKCGCGYEFNLPTQSVRKPKSIMVFGILNIVFAGLWWWHMPPGYPDVRLVIPTPIAVPLGFSIWLVILGIGLLKLKERARRGSIIYAWIEISWVIVMSLLFFAYGFDQGREFIILPGGTPIYSILLLVFMKKKNIKSAFAQTA